LQASVFLNLLEMLSLEEKLKSFPILSRSFAILYKKSPRHDLDTISVHNYVCDENTPKAVELVFISACWPD